MKNKAKVGLIYFLICILTILAGILGGGLAIGLTDMVEIEPRDMSNWIMYNAVSYGIVTGIIMITTLHTFIYVSSWNPNYRERKGKNHIFRIIAICLLNIAVAVGGGYLHGVLLSSQFGIKFLKWHMGYMSFAAVISILSIAIILWIPPTKKMIEW